MSTGPQRDEAVERMIRRALRDVRQRGSGVCPDPETLAAFVEQRLSDNERLTLESHLASCAACQHVLAVVALDDEAAKPAIADAGRRPVRWVWRWLAPAAAVATMAVVYVAVRSGSVDQATAPASSPHVMAQKSDVGGGQPANEAAGAADALAAAREEKAERLAVVPVQEPSRRSGAEAPPLLKPPPKPPPKAPGPQPLLPCRLDPLAEWPLLPRHPGWPAPPRCGHSGTPDDGRCRRSAANAGRDRGSGSAPCRRGDRGGLGEGDGRSDGGRAHGSHSGDARAGGFTGSRVGLADRRGWFPCAIDGCRQDVAAAACGVTADLTAGHALSPSVCWIVGKAGIVLLTTDGEAWVSRPLPEPVDLTAVEAVDTLTATVTAADGRRFVTTDGGITWRVHQRPSPAEQASPPQGGAEGRRP